MRGAYFSPIIVNRPISTFLEIEGLPNGTKRIHDLTQLDNNVFETIAK